MIRKTKQRLRPTPDESATEAEPRNFIITVTTLKDTLPNVQHFVAGNLANGVDHMVIFLEEPTEDVQEFLKNSSHVTFVITDSAWWQHDRPNDIVVRQIIANNLLKSLLVAIEWPAWLFSIDGDEIAIIDRTAINELPDECSVLSLRPLEAVSKASGEKRPVLFKRLLGEADLNLLYTLGTVSTPHNGAYFRGHIAGKAGMRPSLDRWLKLHIVVDNHGEKMAPYSTDSLKLLHYDSYSGDEFLRKWKSKLRQGAQGALPGFRALRRPTALALQALLDKDLTPEQAHPYLVDIFERTSLDHETQLDDLGLLEHHAPLEGDQRPRPLPGEGAGQLENLLLKLRESPKRPFQPGSAPDPWEIVHTLSVAGVEVPTSALPETRDPLIEGSRPE